MDHQQAAVISATDKPYQPIKLSLKETGELLGFSYPSMLELANQAGFPAFKCMGKWIIPYAKLIEWMEAKAGGGQYEAFHS